MTRSSKIITIIIVILIIATAIGATFNKQYAKQRIELLEAAEIIVLENGTEIKRLDLDDIQSLQEKEFTAKLKSSVMKAPEEHTYTGIALMDLISYVGASLKGKNKVVIRSLDGYVAALRIEEVQKADNVYLAYKDNGKYLGTYKDKDGQGPYMLVIREDGFSQRWAKYVCEIEIM